MNAALSHEIFVSGLGSSWSQPLFSGRVVGRPVRRQFYVLFDLRRGSGDQPGPHRLLPERLEHRGLLEVGERLRDRVVQPRRFHDVERVARRAGRGRFRRPHECNEQFDRGLAAVQRRDERLLNGDRAVVPANVTPRFEVVRLVDVPLAQHPGFVLVLAEVQAVLGRVGAEAAQRAGEVEVGGR
jgi:hypothetical protein